MVDTRRSKANMVSVKMPEELTRYNNRSENTNETEELLKLFVAMFSTLQLKRDTKIKQIVKKFLWSL